MNNDRLIQAMGLLRLVSGATELAAAALILRTMRMEEAMRVNALLGLIGPTVFAVVSAIGLVGLVDRVSVARAAVIVCGIALVFAGTRG